MPICYFRCGKCKEITEVYYSEDSKLSSSMCTICGYCDGGPRNRQRWAYRIDEDKANAIKKNELKYGK